MEVFIMNKIKIKGFAVGEVKNLPLSENYDYEFIKTFNDIEQFAKEIYNKNPLSFLLLNKDKCKNLEEETLEKASIMLKEILYPQHRTPGFIDLDDEDFINTFKNPVFTTFGFGTGTGKNKITNALVQLFTSPFLTLKGATKLFIDIKHTPYDYSIADGNYIADKLKECSQADNCTVTFSDKIILEYVDKVEISVFACNYI